MHELAFLAYKAFCNKTGVSDVNNMGRLGVHVLFDQNVCFTGLLGHATHSSMKHIAMQQNADTESTGHIAITPGNIIHAKLNN